MKKAAISLRLDEAQASQVATLAAQWDVNEATVIRWALKALYDYVVANDGKLPIPIDFTELWRLAGRVSPSTREVARLNEDPSPYMPPKKTGTHHHR